MEYIVANWYELFTAGLSIIGAASIIAFAIAPLTRTKRDDKLAVALKRVHAWLSALALNSNK